MTDTLTIGFTTYTQAAASLGAWSGPDAGVDVPPMRISSRVELMQLQAKPQVYVKPVDDEFDFLQALILDVECSEPGHFVLSESLSGAYGAGRTVDEAATDLQSMLTDLYEELTGSEPHLSQTLRRRLSYLRTLIQPKQHN